MLRKPLFHHHLTAHPAWITVEYLAVLIGTGAFMLIPDGYWHRLLFFGPLAVYALLILWRTRRLHGPSGLSLRNTFNALPDYLIGTFVIGVMILLALFVGSQALQIPGTTAVWPREFDPPPLFPYVAVAAPLLELVYRTFLITRLRHGLRPLNAALLAAFAATFTQIQITAPFLLGAAFFANVMLGWLYAHKPNWLLASLAHAGLFGMLLFIFRIWIGLE
jgi:hypothetical protein